MAGNISAVRAFAQRHPILNYYALVFAISWGGILTLVAPGHRCSQNKYTTADRAVDQTLNHVDEPVPAKKPRLTARHASGVETPRAGE